MQRIVIQGQLVRLEDVTLVHQTTVDAFLATLQAHNEPNLFTITPSTLLAILPGAYSTTWVLTAIPPAVRTIPIHTERSVESAIYAWPWTILAFQINTGSQTAYIQDIYVFMTKRRPITLEEPAIIAVLPNLYSTGRLCVGSTTVNMDLPLAQALDYFTNEFYNTRFNTDLGWPTPIFPDTRGAVRHQPDSYLLWEQWEHAQPLSTLLANAQERELQLPNPRHLDPAQPDRIRATLFANWSITDLELLSQTITNILTNHRRATNTTYATRQLEFEHEEEILNDNPDAFADEDPEDDDHDEEDDTDDLHDDDNPPLEGVDPAQP